jgi:hypothetical protein
MEAFTRLEREVLDWIAQRTRDPALAAQCASACPVKREHTGAGLYVDLAIPDGVPPITNFDYGEYDPVIESPDLPFGGGMVLFCENARLKLLEIYAFGNEFPESLDVFELRSWESRAEPPNA